MRHYSHSSIRRAFEWHQPLLCAWLSLVTLGACSASLDDGEADGLPNFGGVPPGSSMPLTPAPGNSAGSPSNPAASPGGGEQTGANGSPITPAANGGTGSSGNGSNTGAGGAAMVGSGDGTAGSGDGNVGAAGSANGAAGTVGMEPPPPPPVVPPPVVPPPVEPPPVVQPPVPTAPDTVCPANASFCAGFEGATFPAGSQFDPSYLAADALGTQMRFDNTVANSGNQSLHLPAGANFYRMLSVPVPANDFWIRLYTRSDVGFGADGSVHAAIFMGSIVAPGGDYNADRAVEIAEQHDQILLNVKDSLFGTSGTNPSGQPGTTLEDDTWTCMEARFNGNTGNVNVFVEGAEIINAAGWQPPMTFRSFRFGYLRYTSPTRDVWVDDVVVATSRVGCL